MILKNKSLQAVQSPQAYAGQKQEQDVAFFLRRAFKDHPQVLVINDFKFSFNDETAQIDHLIVYTYGFILIESKSIKGQVKVNQQGEWTRSHQGNWFGMASPIKQVELQQALLLQLLSHYRSEILGKLLGFKQQGFRLREWDHLCAVSSDAIINRDTMPKQISEKLVKTEFLVDKLNEIMNLKGKFTRLVNFTDTRPDFSQDELNSVADFLISHDIDKYHSQTQCEASEPLVSTHKAIEQDEIVIDSESLQQAAKPQPVMQLQEPHPPYQAPQNNVAPQLKLLCKHCGESADYQPMYGKYGYYIHCNQCTKNTPMKQDCPQCQSKHTRVQKRQETYTLNCQECSFSQRVI
ncbi:nuclease-related domain-containing protein [Shewanella sp. Isolate7]|uniref:nuclease-related domain-containing protein n=1 Tax=Shewanella sp. Isolate7 TaxID=2908528 RepID=UPI001EFD6726|nr:nuclease-related domain-containing protein [Shewanella sp. Isolate7]MCG9723167.1 NERD domain-containing protein [Shewanella sp. Isolate7]